MNEYKECIILSVAFAIFLFFMWIGFYWLSSNLRYDLAFLQMTSLGLLMISSTILIEYEYGRDRIWDISNGWKEVINWSIVRYILILFVIFMIGCYLLSGSPSVEDFVNKYFINVILERQL